MIVVLQVLVEPVDKWQNLAGGNLIVSERHCVTTLLHVLSPSTSLQGRMYEDAERWGYLFQSYVLLTMMELHHKTVVRAYTTVY